MNYGKIYHVFNHANGFELLFEDNYFYEVFIMKLEIYILPYAEVLAFCFIPNHFHLVIRIRSEQEIVKYLRLIHQSKKLPYKKAAIPVRLLQLKEPEKFFRRRFSDFFNSFTRHTNLVRKRKGSLFIKSYKFKLVDTQLYLKYLIYYVHLNPVKHGLRKSVRDWQWSSYRSYLWEDFDFVETEFIIDFFGGIDKFVEYHNRPYTPLKYYESLDEKEADFLAQFKYL
jgi:REP element-mobilizing transposase RayT